MRINNENGDPIIEVGDDVMVFLILAIAFMIVGHC